MSDVFCSPLDGCSFVHLRCEALLRQEGLEMATDSAMLSPATQAPQKRCKHVTALNRLSWKSYFTGSADRRGFQRGASAPVCMNVVPKLDSKDRGIFLQQLRQHDKSMRKHGHRGEDYGGARVC